MATVIVMMEQFVSAEDIDEKNVVCPQCKANSFVLIGNSQVGRKEDWQNGQLISTECDTNHVFELEIIECLYCNTRSRIKPTEMMRLEQRNQILRKKVMDLTGEDLYGEGKPN